MEELFAIENELTWTDLGNGMRRKILAHQPELMLVKVAFEKGAVGVLHQHPHVQTSYVSSGKFRFSIAGEERILQTGDSCVVPGNLLHGCVCLEAGELIDTFTPVREDFL